MNVPFFSRSTSRSPRRSAAALGFTMVELLAAMAVFLLVILAAYQVYMRANEGFKRGVSHAQMTQNARVAAQQLIDDIRMAGYDIDRDGENAGYPNQADEAIEFMGRRVIVVRANFDGEREPSLELPSGTEGADGACCPVVTTENREVVMYALTKPAGADDPSDGEVEVKFDTTGTMDEPNMAGVFDDSFRDAHVDGMDLEEEITITGIETGDLDDPPYTLLRITFDEDGNPVRAPLVDNIRSLEFRYFYEDGTCVRDDPSVAPEPDFSDCIYPGGGDDDRAIRWNVRQIGIDLVAMEAEPDMRWDDPDDTVNEYTRKRRKFPLSAKVVPNNLGQRGKTDEGFNRPAGPEDVRLCVGPCNAVIVSFLPPPFEENIRDYVVTLCDGEACLEDLSNRRASFVVSTNLDLTGPEPREVAVFTYDDDRDIETSDNLEWYAQVVARDEGGSQSEEVHSVNSASLEAATRPEQPLGRRTILDNGTPTEIPASRGSGYDPQATDWPDADPTNASDPLIVTTDTSEHYPVANAIEVSFRPPQYALNEGAAVGNGSDGTNWTTKPLGGGVTAPLTTDVDDDPCRRYLRESTPEDPTDDPAHRTPVTNLRKAPGTPNTYVFRVSGDDPWNWDGEDDENAFNGGTEVTDPKDFIPGPANLHDFVYLPLNSNGVTYVDRADYDWREYGDEDDAFDNRFEGPISPFGPAGSAVPAIRATAPGTVYYYRFRVVTQCWEDGQGLVATMNGVHDDFEADPNPLTAWSRNELHADEDQWRERALSISPFFPPLNPDPADSLKPNPAVDDADDIIANAGITASAIPGYALPPLGPDSGDYLPPEAPSELYFARTTEGGGNLLPAFGARLIFNAARRAVPATPDDGPPPSATYRHYELYRVEATQDQPTAAEMDYTPSGNPYFRFTTRGSRADWRLTLDQTREGAPAAVSDLCPDGGTPVDDPVRLNCLADTYGPGGFPYIYRLVSVQAPDWALSDGIDTSAAEVGAPSPPFLFPCSFYDQVEGVTITATPTDTDTTAVDIAVDMVDAADPDLDDPNCTELGSARLLGYHPVTGDFLGSSGWVDATNPGTPQHCNLSFGQSHVDDARRGFTDAARYVVELSDATNAAGTGVAVGCRVRSDHLGGAGPSGTPSPACATGCGTNNNGEILGRVAENDVEVIGQNENIMRITIPNVCVGQDDFPLYQLEFLIENETGGAFPLGFQRAEITEGIRGTLPRELPAFAPGSIDESESDPAAGGMDSTMRLRWFDSFFGDYPVVDGTADDIVIELTFGGGTLCDAKLREFNFRTLYDNGAGSLRELLCTRRASDPQDPSLYGPDEPDIDGDPLPGATGDGRGPEANGHACGGPGGCTPSCNALDGTGRCPLENEMDAAGERPDTSLRDGGVGESGFIIRVTYDHTCTDCDTDLIAIGFGIQGQPTRPCFDAFPFTCMPTLDSAKIIHADMTEDVLPPPTLGPGADPDTNCCGTREYSWNNLNNVTIVSGETFHLDLKFTNNMQGTQFEYIDLVFGDPLPDDDTGNRPSCEVPSADLPLIVPTP